jgi:YbbR domain-containing protein
VSRFPQIVARNWQLKLSALAMAVLLWTVPRFEAQSSRVLEDLPIRVQLNDPEWVLVGEPLPTSIRATLSGPARELFALGVDRPPVVIPVDRVSSADTAVLLRFSWLRIPGRDGVVVEDLSPGAVSLSFERISTRPISLAARLTGELPEGLSLVEPPEVTPSVVQALGAASKLGTMDSLFLRALDLSRVRASGTFVQMVDTAGSLGVVVSPTQAAVRLRVEETAERRLADVPLSLPVLDSDPQLQARPSAVSVILVGARSLVEGLVPDSLRATVSPGRARALAPGQEESRAYVILEGVPALVQAEIEPPWVLLRRPAGEL